MHSAGVVGCSGKRVLVLHVLSLAVCTAFWSGLGWAVRVSRDENEVPSSRGQLGPLPLRSRGPHQIPRALT